MAWQPARNHIARLTLPPKHQLCDPALAARLLGVDAQALVGPGPAVSPLLREGTLVGQLFESLVTLSVRVFAQAAEAVVRHLRTKSGEREVDLLVLRGDHRVLAIEVKLSARVDDSDTKQLTWLARELGDELLDAVIITTGTSAYRRKDGIAVVPAALLGP